MLSQILLFALIVTAMLAPFIAWELGTRNPKQSVREKIEDRATCKIISWYHGRQWECIDITETRSMFGPLRTIVLKNGDDQIKLHNGDIVKGERVELKPRERNESGVWVSVIDEFMYPVLCS